MKESIYHMVFLICRRRRRVVADLAQETFASILRRVFRQVLNKIFAYGQVNLVLKYPLDPHGGYQLACFGYQPL
jgi:hypothetical protein